jgi:hypothetical protein
MTEHSEGIVGSGDECECVRGGLHSVLCRLWSGHSAQSLEDWRFEFAEKLEDATTKSCTELAHAVILPYLEWADLCMYHAPEHAPRMMNLCERVFETMCARMRDTDLDVDAIVAVMEMVRRLYHGYRRVDPNAYIRLDYGAESGVIDVVRDLKLPRDRKLELVEKLWGL